MSMRVTMLSLFCLIAAAFGARADEPTPAHIAIARELVTAAGASSGLDRIIPALVDEIRRQSITRPEMTKDIDEVLKAMAPELELQKQQAITVAARSYAKYLSEPDIRAAVAFFKTPAGAHYVTAQPDITEDLVSTVTAWSQIAAEYVQTRVRAEMLKRGHQMQ